MRVKRKRFDNHQENIPTDLSVTCDTRQGTSETKFNKNDTSQNVAISNTSNGKQCIRYTESTQCQNSVPFQCKDYEEKSHFNWIERNSSLPAMRTNGYEATGMINLTRPIPAHWTPHRFGYRNDIPNNKAFNNATMVLSKSVICPYKASHSIPYDEILRHEREYNTQNTQPVNAHQKINPTQIIQTPQSEVVDLSENNSDKSVNIITKCNDTCTNNIIDEDTVVPSRPNDNQLSDVIDLTREASHNSIEKTLGCDVVVINLTTDSPEETQTGHENTILDETTEQILPSRNCKRVNGGSSCKTLSLNTPMVDDGITIIPKAPNLQKYANTQNRGVSPGIRVPEVRSNNNKCEELYVVKKALCKKQPLLNLDATIKEVKKRIKNKDNYASVSRKVKSTVQACSSIRQTSLNPHTLSHNIPSVTEEKTRHGNACASVADSIMTSTAKDTVSSARVVQREIVHTSPSVSTLPLTITQPHSNYGPMSRNAKTTTQTCTSIQPTSLNPHTISHTIPASVTGNKTRHAKRFKIYENSNVQNAFASVVDSTMTSSAKNIVSNATVVQTERIHTSPSVSKLPSTIAQPHSNYAPVSCKAKTTTRTCTSIQPTNINPHTISHKIPDSVTGNKTRHAKRFKIYETRSVQDVFASVANSTMTSSTKDNVSSATVVRTERIHISPSVSTLPPTIAQPSSSIHLTSVTDSKHQQTNESDSERTDERDPVLGMRVPIHQPGVKNVIDNRPRVNIEYYITFSYS